MKRFLFRQKEKFFKHFFVVQDYLIKVLGWLSSIFNMIVLLCGFLFATLMIARLGFYHHQIVQDNVDTLIRNIFIVTYFIKFAHDLIGIICHEIKLRWFDFGLFLLATIVIFANTQIAFFAPLANSFVGRFGVMAIMLTMILISEFYKAAKHLMTVKMSPPLLFASSFLIMIFIGSGLLMLPNVHVGDISYTEALFTSTSAICISGLSVLDLSTVLTPKGTVILMLLIQVGGLGIMVFTGLFAFAFTGTVSFKDRMFLKDIFSSDTMNDIFTFMFHIIAITLLFETIGAATIYFSIYDLDVPNPILFSFFHSVSAFCNCGLSTLPNGFVHEIAANNNILLMTVALLATIGGIGFPVLIAAYSITRYRTSRLLHITSRPGFVPPVGSDMASRIVLITTASILVLGTLGYYLLESDNTLANETTATRWIKSFFCCATSRTSGFNVYDTSTWTNATMIMIMGIMWIGGSPGSTGGGIKTTTFAIALCSIVSFIRGNRYIEIGYHRIGFETISRVLVLIVMSFIVIFFAFIAFALFEPDKNPLFLIFDTISMFSTTGLSMNNTAELSIQSKVLTMFMMFLGRVGPLTLLSGIFVSRKPKYAKYPYKNLTIN